MPNLTQLDEEIEGLTTAVEGLLRRTDRLADALAKLAVNHVGNSQSIDLELALLKDEQRLIVRDLQDMHASRVSSRVRRWFREHIYDGRPVIQF